MTNTTVDRVTLPEYDIADIEHARNVVDIVSVLVEPLARALGPSTEVLLHDLTRIPGSIVAIAQSITDRSVGGPPTDLGLMTLAAGRAEHLVAYGTEHDGRRLRSTSIFFRGPSGKAVASLCLNSDIEDLTRANEIIASLTRIVAPAPGATAPSESFATSVESLSDRILREALGTSDIPVELMKKQHKVEIVRELKRRGFFTLKESVDGAAKALGVTRYSVYNYLNEINGTASTQ